MGSGCRGATRKSAKTELAAVIPTLWPKRTRGEREVTGTQRRESPAGWDALEGCDLRLWDTASPRRPQKPG